MEDSSCDLLGIGLGPFNLSLAALADGTDGELDALFLEQEPSFDWHGGMLIEGTALQIPFIADLVSITDPTSPHSFLNYLRQHDRMWEFYNHQEFHLERREYNQYCKWVADRLDECRFSRRVETIEDDGDAYLVTAVDPETNESHQYRAENLAVGVGSKPYVPPALRGQPTEDVFHTSTYLDHRQRCLDADSITVVGSGQSAAEVFLDLLRRQPGDEYRLDWFTRSDGFYPVDPSKLTRDVRTPDYMDYFYDLDAATRDQRLETQDLLYKGISPSTSAAIYDTLYQQTVEGDVDVGMLPTTEVLDVERTTDDEYRLTCHQWEQDCRFTHESEVVVLGTGYHRPTPAFFEPIEANLGRDEKDRLTVEEDFSIVTEDLPGEIFLQNDAMYAHGFNVADLSIGCYRNARIINSLLGREVFHAGAGDRFQSFDAREFVDRSPNSELERERVASAATDRGTRSSPRGPPRRR